MVQIAGITTAETETDETIEIEGIERDPMVVIGETTTVNVNGMTEGETVRHRPESENAKRRRRRTVAVLGLLAKAATDVQTRNIPLLPRLIPRKALDKQDRVAHLSRRRDKTPRYLLKAKKRKAKLWMLRMRMTKL